MKYKITFISDTHGKHKQITEDLPGGDIIICAGDISSMGYEHEIREFLAWYSRLNQYTTKIFIAGNHDWGFQDNVEKVKQILLQYPNVVYLQDDMHLLGEDHDDYEQRPKVWGSPWQPEFYNWAFNLPRNSPEMWEKWLMIPENTDILITHGPAHGVLDKVIGGWENLGCEMLAQRIKDIKPKIHVCGHIHSAYGYQFVDETHYFNAAVLGEDYRYSKNKPISFIWDRDTNSIDFI
jgi:Icc-related predicted phosphoesterase